LCGRDGRCGEFHHHLAKVLLVQDDGVVAAVAVVGSGDELSADLYLGGQTDNAGADLVFD
jgi:hypothetical protein